ncbi:waprin-Rha1-like [Cyprinus carpio]|uniref:Waprin-Rha1-like n=1 Tax=Cyprinus carpio TaxID=7962 RepID=A0A9Q9VNS2_CYPCA|nr:waprin-Rha1-like [Cyprinus carpio]
MTARVYCSLIAVLSCLSGYLSITHATQGGNTAKPGECPPQTSGRRLCTTSCNSDSNCPTNEKCCSNGCGHYCTPPYTVKPGQCPKLNKIPAGAESCFHDGQCPATQKCCPTTSGHACSEPHGRGSGLESGEGRGSGQGSRPS